MKRVIGATILGCSIVGLMFPSMAFAAKHNVPAQPKVVFGTICSYTAGSSVTISQSCGSNDVTVSIGKHAFLDYKGTTSPAPQPVAGDSGAAFVWYKKSGAAVAWKLEYSESAFAYATALFPGTYVSSTGDCTNGTLTTVSLGSKPVDHTFVTNANTAYESQGKASTCAVVTGAYASGQPNVLWAKAMTSGFWYASRINAKPANAHRSPYSDQHVVFGTICSYTAGQSVVISDNCGSSDDVTVALGHTWFDYKGTTTPTPAPVVGDSAAAYLRWNKDSATAAELAYGEDPFAFARGLFGGTYVSSTGNCTAGTVTVQLVGSSAQATFSTDVNTIFENKGKASSCSTVSGAFASGEPFVILADEMTDGSWYAARINANPLIAHRHPGRNARLVVGTVCSYTAGQSMTISDNCGSSDDVTVSLNNGSALVYAGSTSPAPAPVPGDSAVVFLRWTHKAVLARRVEYAENPFAYADVKFLGTYVSDTGTCSGGTITVQTHKAAFTFNADSYTVYLNANKASTCAAVTAGYTSGETVAVAGEKFTDGSWYATKVDVSPKPRH